VIATGIANIWARDATAAINGANTLNEAYDERFVLGLGVSHAPAVKVRGHEYARPLTAMRTYLDAIDAPHLRRSGPAASLPRGAGGAAAEDARAGGRADSRSPPLLRTARTHRQGSRDARPGALLAPEQAVVLETDAGRAREIGRRHMRPI